MKTFQIKVRFHEKEYAYIIEELSGEDTRAHLATRHGDHTGENPECLLCHARLSSEDSCYHLLRWKGLESLGFSHKQCLDHNPLIENLQKIYRLESGALW